MHKQSNSLYLIYARKSSEDSSRQVQSNGDQTRDALSRAERDGVRVPKANILTEEMSAKAPGRPVFNRMIEMIQAANHTTVYCWHLNRLTRNPIDEGTLKWLLQQGKLTVITPHQVFDQDTNMVVTSVEASQGNEWVIKLSKDVKRGLKGKWHKGIATSVPPGYMHIGERGDKVVATDEDRFSLVQRAFRLILRGTAPMDALDTLNNEWGFLTLPRRKLGGRPIAKATWYEMLRNPFYYGRFIQNGEEYEGTHPTMITEAEYWRIQELLGVAGRPRPQQQQTPAFLGLLRCGECDGAITRELKQQVRCTCKYKYSSRHRDTCPKCGLHASQVAETRKHEYEIYHCTKQKGTKSGKSNNGCSQGSISRADLEKEILKVLETIELPQAFVDWSLECLDAENDEELNKQRGVLASLQRGLAAKQEELARHSRMYTRGLVSEEEEDDYFNEKQQMRKERKDLLKKISELQEAIDTWQDKTEGVFNFARNAKSHLEHSPDPRTKTQILADLGTEAKIIDKKVTLELQPPFIAIQKVLGEMRTEYPSIEPAEVDDFVRKTAGSKEVSDLKSAWLRRSDSNRRQLD